MGMIKRMDGVIGVRGQKQWMHCGFSIESPASLVLEGDHVSLASYPLVTSPPSAATTSSRRRGMAIDQHGRIYRAGPADGTISVSSLQPQGRLALGPLPEILELPNSENGPVAPAALAASTDDHLFVIGETEPAVFVYDLLTQRYIGSHTLPRKPLDIVASGGMIFVLLDTPSQWLVLSACHRPQTLRWPDGLDGASRLTFSSCGSAFVLIDAETPQANVVMIGRPRRSIAIENRIPIPGARDIIMAKGHTGSELVAGCSPGMPLPRFLIAANSVQQLPPLDGRTYDGSGLCLSSEGMVLFSGATEVGSIGLVRTAPVRRRYASQGELVLYRLDSGQPGNQWGRLLIDACIPDGTEVVSLMRSSDDPDEGPYVARQAPANLAGPLVLAGDAMAVMPSQASLISGIPWVESPLVRGGATVGEGAFATYETAVLTAPGRYLWIRLVLSGRGASTPRLKHVMCEKHGHEWLKHLPRAFARRTPETESYLQHFLTPTAAMLTDAESKSLARHRLFDAAQAPSESLAWLGETLGFPIEANWPESVVRQMLAAANELFRKRGTIEGLRRMLGILTGARISIVEQFRLRGGGGIGGDPASTSQAILGSGFRVGGGMDTSAGISGAASIDSAIASHAHRFKILVHGRLSPELEKAVSRLLDRHRPAHTLVEFCTVDSGLRAGVGAHVGLTAIVGPSSGFKGSVVGSALVGKGTLLARGPVSHVFEKDAS